MAVFRFTVNGVSLMSYLAEDGIKWTRNDIDGPNAGRNLKGDMIRDRVTSKVRLDITCRPLSASEASVVLNAIAPEFVTVRYIDPMEGAVTKTMYSNNAPATAAYVYPDGTVRWEGITFPLIEK